MSYWDVLSEAMDILTSNELESMGIFTDRSTKLVFQEEEFVAGPSFSTNNKSIGINFCIQEEKNGYRCLLIESSSSVTVWKCIKKTKDQRSDRYLSKAATEKLVERCRLELTRCIGPMASLIIDELKGEVNNMPQTQFVDLIAEQIPDPKIASAFKKNMS